MYTYIYILFSLCRQYNKNNEDIHIPDDIKNDFMKLLKNVVSLNSKNNLYKSQHEHLKEDEKNKHSENPALYNKLFYGQDIHNNSSFFNKIINHIKKYLMYYIIGVIVFFSLALVMQSSDVSNKKKIKNDVKKDKNNISNYTRDIKV